MTKTNQNSIEKTYGGLAAFTKGLIVAFIITFACIIAFALVIKMAGLPDSVITPVNLGIKALSVGIGSLMFSKRSSRGFLKGVLFATVYTTLAFVIFSVLAGEFCITVGLALDFAFTAIVGAIFGIVGVNTKK
ncbi:MAG: TIGR04086 family membrane protein [Clostridia bacterium]|nr:TIGR04086 family membrane protein [Clostridia bacterium]